MDSYPPEFPAFEPSDPLPLDGFHDRVSGEGASTREELDQVVALQRQLGHDATACVDDLCTLADSWTAELPRLSDEDRAAGGCEQVRHRPDLVYAASALRVEWMATFGPTHQAACLGGWLLTFRFLAGVNVEVLRPLQYPVNVKAVEPSGFRPRHEVALVALGDHLDHWRRLIDAGTAINDLEREARERLRADRSDRAAMSRYQVANLTRVGLKLNRRRHDS